MANNAFDHAITTASSHARRLRRSRSNRWIGGVAAGLAETYGWNPAVVRLVFVATLLLPCVLQAPQPASPVQCGKGMRAVCVDLIGKV